MVYRFHDYTLDPASREVRHGAHRLALEPKVFQVLLYLLEHRNRMVPKAELLEQCWPETFVSEAALTRCLARLRKAVQPTPTVAPVIETRHRSSRSFPPYWLARLAPSLLPTKPAARRSRLPGPARPLLGPSAGRSPCCVVLWWTPPFSPSSSTPKTFAR